MVDGLGYSEDAIIELAILLNGSACCPPLPDREVVALLRERLRQHGHVAEVADTAEAHDGGVQP